MAETQTYKTTKTGGARKAGRVDTDTKVSEQEQWLYDNPEALAVVKRGLADSAAGRVGKRQSYAEYADDTVED